MAFKYKGSIFHLILLTKTLYDCIYNMENFHVLNVTLVVFICML